MADPLSEPSPAPLDTREARRRRLQQAASGRGFFAGYRRPWLTRGLLGLLGVVHLALGLRLWSQGKTDLLGALVVARPEALLIRAGAQYAPAIREGEAWRLLSCVFLHADGLHVFLNGMALLGLGRLCEALYGRPRLLLLFVACGLTGAVTSFLGGHRLSVGASGAIFGLMGAPVVFGWRHRAELPQDLGDRLRRSLLPWVALNLFIGLIVPAVDNLAHVGGLVAGGLLALVLGNRVVPGREGRPAAGVAMAVACLALLGLAALGVAGQWT